MIGFSKHGILAWNKWFYFQASVASGENIKSFSCAGTDQSFSSRPMSFISLESEDCSTPGGLLPGDYSNPGGLLQGDCSNPEGLVPGDCSNPGGLLPGDYSTPGEGRGDCSTPGEGRGDCSTPGEGRPGDPSSSPAGKQYANTIQEAITNRESNVSNQSGNLPASDLLQAPAVRPQ